MRLLFAVTLFARKLPEIDRVLASLLDVTFASAILAVVIEPFAMSVATIAPSARIPDVMR